MEGERPESERVRTNASIGGRTKQSFKGETNINEIMAKYQRSGTIDHISEKTPRYGDFSQVGDFASALRLVKQSEESFMELPSDLRSEFDNDPGQLLDFIEGGGDIEEMQNDLRADKRPEAPEAPEATTVPTPQEPTPESPVQGGE